MEAIDRVYRFALHLTRDPADAEDLVQETYLRAYQHRDQYRPGTNCTAWLFTICRNLWTQQWRRNDRVTAYDTPELDALAGRSPQERSEEVSAARFDLPEYGALAPLLGPQDAPGPASGLRCGRRHLAIQRGDLMNPCSGRQPGR